MTISQPKSNEEWIASCIKTAIERIDKVDADANKEKTQIIQGLAKDLDGKVPTNIISNEIVHQLHGDIDRQVEIDTLENVVGPHPSIIKRTGFNDNGNEVTQNIE